VTGIKALTFDVFGTTVDHRGTIIAEGEALARAKHLSIDWPTFADAWRAGYKPAMNRVRTGELPWTSLDRLHRMMLERLLADFEITSLTPAEADEFNRVWHRLTPWPDALDGLTRVKRKFVIAPLSNGNLALLTNMAKHAGLPWDCVLGCDLARHYKPDPEVYRMACDLLDLTPAEIMMVAAHQDDLRAAKAVGFQTAFVRRPKEGPNGDHGPADPAWDFVVNDFNELASRLGA
jgi:2-haloacid dehalogenase